MHLERLREYFTILLVTVCGVLLALYAGAKAGAGEFKLVLAAMGGLLLLIIGSKAGEKTWLLIPLSMSLDGFIPALGLGITIHNFVVLYVFGIFLILKCFKRNLRKPIFDLADVFLLLLLGLLAFAFFRNPTGALGFGSERIGGRPYSLVAIACFGYWVLSRVTITPREALWLPVGMVASNLLHAGAAFIGDMFPTLGGFLVKFYSGFAPRSLQTLSTAAVDPDAGTGRTTYLGRAGSSMMQAICSYFKPLSAMLPIYPLSSLIFYSGMLAVLLSGFRSGLAGVILFFLLAGWFRSGVSHLVLSTLIVAPLLAILMIGQGTLFELPRSAQRTLSFLPGHWDPIAVSDAEGSTEWRMEMWIEALTTDRYIKNKILGDGFGADRRDLEAVVTAESRGIRMHLDAEGQAIMGGFHSGPISTIRVVGFVGLIVYYLLTLVMACKAYVLIVRAKNTSYFPFALFTLVSTVYYPLMFTFVFGAFDSDIGRTIVTLGLMKALGASLERYPSNKEASGSAARPAVA